MADSILSIQHVTKRFGAGNVAVDDVSLDIGRNEFFALLGPSGCGKTTLLRMIAGLDAPTAGRIVIDGADMASVPPNRRPVNMVFQSYAVFPHMSVRQNVEYGLMVVGTPKSETRRRAMETLKLVQLAHLADRAPDQLSGGQRQRVALARALVKRPKVLLLDEPLSALDAKLRESMQTELAQLQRQLGFTFIIVTHDQDEALSIASRIAVMHAGAVSQVGAPRELYERPASRLVAEFIGRVNLFEAEIVGTAGPSVVCEAPGLGRIEAPAAAGASGRVCLAVRPERLRLSSGEPAAEGAIKIAGVVRDVAYFGDASRVAVTPDVGPPLSVSIPNASRHDGDAIALDQRVWVSWSPADMLVLPA
ncbi:MAG TPA: ABC transporter ATP-binding protein [Thermomicrobiales bacterium]|nr:ABC transporter ATP-binding protein [Thermomicrobiales bacterium]